MNCSIRFPTLKMSLALCLMVLLTSGHAGERMLYKSVLPSGSVIYSDAPAQGADTVNRIWVEPHPDDPKAAAQAALEGQRRRQIALASFDRHAKRSDELHARIAQAETEVLSARQVREDGTRIREGDRQGRRWTSQYVQRQADLAAQQARAQSRLTGLRQELAALHP